MNEPLGVPHQAESTAVILDNCARQLRAYGQAIVRPDLDESLQLLMARAAYGNTVVALNTLLESMPPESQEPRRARKP
jgi:hypothetical protein